jgi:hypothetical protein
VSRRGFGDLKTRPELMSWPAEVVELQDAVAG